MNSVANVKMIGTVAPAYQHMTVHADAKYQIGWCYMHSVPRPCFSTKLLEELNDWCRHLRDYGETMGLRYHVIASTTPGVYNLGGDLDLFRNCASRGDREGLFAYGKSCIDALYANISHFDQALTTISLVQGDALGGGFETALSSDVLIAERSAKLGFPEILFNLFPGMGAYSLLSRKIGPKQAERMILGGKLYTAEELHQIGLVDVLAEDGEGEAAVYDYIKRENRARNGFRAIREIREAADPITYRELMQILEKWVDTALRLESRDLKMMERLIARQHQVGSKAA
jgi:DSF synthase